ncbi:MAG: archaemetzincin family Zn-dependent metalloprotease [candidate division NC10 bacterium]
MRVISHIELRWIGNGEVEGGVLEEVRDHAERVFGVPTRITNTDARPPDVFDTVRGQYSSTNILRWVLQDVPADARKVVAITDGDLFIPVLTFVFGEAQLGGKGSVVSTARLGQDYNGLPSPPHMFRARVVKECVHELGHTFGLTHCPSARCVMSRSNTLLDVDAKAQTLCPDCERLLMESQRNQG